MNFGPMRWLTVNLPGQPDRAVLLEKPGPPSMSEETAAQVRELITKGAAGGHLFFALRRRLQDPRRAQGEGRGDHRGAGRPALRHRLRPPRPLRQPPAHRADEAGLSRSAGGGARHGRRHPCAGSAVAALYSCHRLGHTRPGRQGAVAQLVAHHTGSVGVRGSSPLSSTLLTRPFSDSESGFRRFWCQRGGHWSRHGAGGPHSALPIRSAASRPRAGMTWLYVSVVVRICAWPSTSMTTRGCTPSDSSSVAAVCRPSWRRTSRTPASLQQGLPCLPVGLPLDRPPVGLREDEVVVLPEGTGGDALLELGGSVGPQGVDELEWAAPRCGGFARPWAPRRPGPARRPGAGRAGRSVFRWPGRRPPIAGPGLLTDAGRLPAPRSTARRCGASGRQPALAWLPVG